MYYLLDLERTIRNGAPMYWKQNLHGYTHMIETAGIFPEDFSNTIVNSDLDKMTVRISTDQIKRIISS